MCFGAEPKKAKYYYHEEIIPVRKRHHHHHHHHSHHHPRASYTSVKSVRQVSPRVSTTSYRSSGQPVYYERSSRTRY
jgi:hypothetical protein